MRGRQRDSESQPAPGKPPAPADGAPARPAFPILPPQHPHEQAYQLGFDTLLERPPSAEALAALEVHRRGEALCLYLLNRRVLVDLARREVTFEDGAPLRRSWALLVLHYLCAQDVSLDEREVSISHFADCRGYLSVFEKRVIERFLAAAGRTADHFAALSERLGAARLPGPGVCYHFPVLPRVPIAIVRHEGDEELGPGANILYRVDAGHLLPAEDRVVIAELLVDALSGKPIEDARGGNHARRS